LDRDSLGREAWDVIHTVAAYYPEDPSPEQQAAAEGFIRGLAVIYPCAVCAADFQQSLIDNPPR
jgi:FAD-linked sulfhydryl oxidase